MAKIIYIECVACGTKLKMQYAEGLENKMMICPKCKTKSRISDNKFEVKEHEPQAMTQLADSWRPTREIGTLTYSNGELFEPLNLTEGMNTIGRVAKNNDATLQVQDDEKILSRKHFAIDVVKKEGYYEHRLSIISQNTNPLKLNGSQLYQIDIIVLNYGDEISCEGRAFKFEEK